MNIALWALQILLALLFLAAGGSKAFKTTNFKASMDWTKNYSDGQIKLIGWLEILGAIGLILPMAINVAPILTPLAAIGLALTMIFAAILHAKRKENKNMVSTIIILIIAVIIAVGRFM